MDEFSENCQIAKFNVPPKFPAIWYYAHMSIHECCSRVTECWDRTLTERCQLIPLMDFIDYSYTLSSCSCLMPVLNFGNIMKSSLQAVSKEIKASRLFSGTITTYIQFIRILTNQIHCTHGYSA